MDATDDFIQRTLHHEATRNEKILAWLRFGLVLTIAPDFFADSLLASTWWLDVICLIYLVAALWATFRWASRHWFKYVIVMADALVILYATVWDADSWSNEALLMAMALFGAFLIVTAALRLSPWAVAYGTGLVMVDLIVAGIWLDAPFSTVFGAAMILLLLGVLSHLVTMRLTVLMADVTRKERLSRFLPPELVERAAQDPALLQLGGKRQSVTILFADIRGFTPMVEGHQPEDVIEFLNDYLRVTTDVIFHHRGTLDKFMGDCLMALFGAPLSNPDDADRAVHAAVEIMEQVAEFNRRRTANGFCPVEIGIGVNTANVIVGNIGTDRRMDYTVIGDGVNLAARLEKLTKEYETKIIISRSTHERLSDKRGAVAYGGVKVLGRDAPVEIYGVPHAPLKGARPEG
ncbi:MAG: adenylate/guanylate cyclase domain-containing protein [Planctomycetota bacterium]